MRTKIPLITAPRTIEWEPLELPASPDAKQVRIRTEVTAISAGTERRLYEGEQMAADVWNGFADLRQAIASPSHASSYQVTGNLASAPVYPVAVGYNNVGIVEEVGSDVTTVKPGDRVFTLCRHQAVFDALEHQVVPVPPEIPASVAVFAYLATLGLHALRRGGFAPGETVAVVGLGIVGALAAHVAEASGGHVVGLDVAESRRGMLETGFGISTFDPADPELGRKLAAAVGPAGVDLVVEAGRGAASLELAVRIARHKGRVSVISLHPEDLGPLFASDFYAKELSLFSSSNDLPSENAGGGDRFTVNGNIRHILELQRRGRLKLESVQAAAYPSSRIDEAYGQLAQTLHTKLGVILDWNAAADPA